MIEMMINMITRIIIIIIIMIFINIKLIIIKLIIIIIITKRQRQSVDVLFPTLVVNYASYLNKLSVFTSVFKRNSE